MRPFFGQVLLLNIWTFSVASLKVSLFLLGGKWFPALEAIEDISKQPAIKIYLVGLHDRVKGDDI
jgi:hypothetical protein